ncbi:MAG: thiosulfate oxidation carrier complex protein SoxZ [Hyphomonas sp.]|nr:thiosulfate oxidation carrier complex protein SoxZ [Hyphomonas sp.]
MIRISIPDTAKAGEILDIKAMIQHPMETGYRRNGKGQVIPRDIITSFECTYGGVIVFKAGFQPGIAANPFLSFCLRAAQSGPIEFKWTDQRGETWSETRELTVS